MDRNALADYTGAPGIHELIISLHAGGDQSTGREGISCDSGESQTLRSADRC